MKILVTGVGGPAGRNICEMLTERNHHVVGTDIRNVDLPGMTFYLVPPASSPSFVTELSQIAHFEKVDMVIPTVSEELPVLSRRQENWKMPVIIASKDAVLTAHDKYHTFRFLSRHGLSVPRSILPSQVTQFDDIQAFLGWPCLSKPRVGRGGRGVTVYGEDNWSEICRLNDSFILQEFVSGTEYCPNLFCSDPSHTVTVVLEKLQLKNGLTGNAMEVRRADHPTVAELAEKAVRALGLTGPSDIDIRCREDGTPVILEINARFGANIKKAPEVLKVLLQNYRTISPNVLMTTDSMNRSFPGIISGAGLAKISGIGTLP